jgi:hypothetical protein
MEYAIRGSRRINDLISKRPNMRGHAYVYVTLFRNNKNAIEQCSCTLYSTEICGFEEILRDPQTKYIHQQLNMVEYFYVNLK